MSLSAFLKTNAFKVDVEEVVISERFTDEKGDVIPFKIKPITSGETNAIHKKCMKKGKGGMIDFDAITYQNLITSACVVYPNLKDAELQDSYGVIGESELLSAMLLSGEYQRLVNEVNRINGFKSMGDLIEEAKN